MFEETSFVELCVVLVSAWVFVLFVFCGHVSLPLARFSAGQSSIESLVWGCGGAFGFPFLKPLPRESVSLCQRTEGAHGRCCCQSASAKLQAVQRD